MSLRKRRVADTRNTPLNINSCTAKLFAKVSVCPYNDLSYKVLFISGVTETMRGFLNYYYCWGFFNPLLLTVDSQFLF